jgi:hypothetical protein
MDQIAMCLSWAIRIPFKNIKERRFTIASHSDASGCNLVLREKYIREGEAAINTTCLGALCIHIGCSSRGLINQSDPSRGINMGE